MSRPVRVLVVDDDPLVRSGLTMMLDGLPDIAVVAEAADGADVPAAVAGHRPDVVLMDLRMPGVDGISATRRLRRRPEAPEVVVLTTFDTEDNIIEALRAGATGFLLKDTPPGEIAAAVIKAAQGDPVLSPQVTRRLVAQVTTDVVSSREANHRLTRLSAREQEVARLVAQGLSNAQVARELTLSLPTVKAHVSHVLTKLGLDNRTQVALLAHDAGWV
ncbi:response regulator transcription factor [Intrasporangium sp.]|uniref:response regulator transcription factor n=1 Tax=Intrasporangium sp. TaxID=1925024 RepID=UPI00293AD8C2|nr:response regulator transcription factor [Intrasporangium sp.]MDV3222520.1 response regulator transcription factor [Intrasporangium sp.]